MKIALFIEDGLEQIVLTPESDTEKSILAKIHDGSRRLELKRGQFYDCQGGWKRQTDTFPFSPGSTQNDRDDSTMIVLRVKDGGA